MSKTNSAKAVAGVNAKAAKQMKLKLKLKLKFIVNIRILRLSRIEQRKK